MLEVINRGGSKRNKIIYGAYLSYTQLNEYLSLLLEMGLIEHQDFSSPSFRMTDKGRHFLELHNHINEMIMIVQTK